MGLLSWVMGIADWLKDRAAKRPDGRLYPNDPRRSFGHEDPPRRR